MEEIIHTRGGEGAGDILGGLNTAIAWASYHNRNVHMMFHWGTDRHGKPVTKDYRVVESDRETVNDRFQNMHDRLWNNEIMTFENVWGSDMFEYADTLFQDDAARALHKPKRFIAESGSIEAESGTPFEKWSMSEWKWEREPTISNTIVFWNWNDNNETIKDYKRGPMQRYHWNDLKLELHSMFPDYDIVEVTYRDYFPDVYDKIADCAFCIGYDGMWHTVAKNFGKLFISCSGDIVMPQNCTNPHSPIFLSPFDLFRFLENCSKDPKFLLREQNLAMGYHLKRLSRYIRGNN